MIAHSYISFVIRLAISLIISIVCSYYWGTKKHIGWEWCLALCFLFPITGIVATFLSPNIDKPKPKQNLTIKYLGTAILVFSLLGVLQKLFDLGAGLPITIKDINYFYTGIALIVYGYYMRLVGNGG